MTVVGTNALSADLLAHSVRVDVDHVHLSILAFLHTEQNSDNYTYLAGALSPVSHKGFYQGRRRIS